MGVLNIDLKNINLDDTNYQQDDPDTTILSDFWLGILNFKNAKLLKKMSEELTPIAWHPKRWWDF